MTGRPCPFEDAVLGEIARGTAPDAWPAGLRTHVAGCEECAAAASIASLLSRDDRALQVDADLPSSGQVWWRAQVRQRAEARRAAERPMLVVQAVSAACLVGLLAALVTWYWPSIHAAVATATTVSPASFGLLTWLALGASVIVAPVLLYLAFARD